MRTRKQNEEKNEHGCKQKKENKRMSTHLHHRLPAHDVARRRVRRRVEGGGERRVERRVDLARLEALERPLRRPPRVARHTVRLRDDGHDLVELEAHLEDDHLRGAADAEHGESSEEEGEHRADEKARDDDRLAEVDDSDPRAVDVRRDEAGRSEDGAADGETLARRRRRVPERVERVGHVAHVL